MAKLMELYKLFLAVQVGVMAALAYTGCEYLAEIVPFLKDYLLACHGLLLLSSAWIMGELLWR